MSYQRFKSFMITIFLILFLASCSSPENSLDNIKKVETEVKGIKNPLTGLYMDEKLKYQRPIAVMIENEYNSRPQSGLDKACIVYEILTEGGITRFLSIFLDKDAIEIGPVRSSRPYFIDYALEYDSIYVHYGASPKAYEDLKQLSVDKIDGIYDSITFWRDKNRKSPHNAYTSKENILKSAEKQTLLKPVDAEFIEFCDAEEELRGINVEKFNLNYCKNYYVGYCYDKEKMSYQRLMNNEPHTDRITEEPIYVKNIIVQFHDMKVIDDKGRLDIKTVGEGKGYYICEGVLQEIIWKKDSRRANTEFFYTDGRKLKIKPGRTWIQVMPKRVKLDIVD